MSLPPRRRFKQPESAFLYAGIEAVDVGLQYEILRELASDFAFAVEDPRSAREQVRAAVAALHDVAGVLDRSPSVKDYRAVRRALPELNLPPDGSVRRWLGGRWNGCLTRALLDAVVDGDFATRQIGINDRYSDAELSQALHDCAEDLRHAPTLTEYLHWARRPDVRERPGRRPRSYNPFVRAGGFRNALRAAGVIADDDARIGADQRVLPLHYSYSDQELREALRTVAGRMGHSPRPADYLREREQINRERLAAGKSRIIPSPEVIRKRFGSWNAALSAAGLDSVHTPFRPFRANPRPTYSEAEKLEWIRRAWVEVGEPFTLQAYRNWRETKLVAEQAIPSPFTLTSTFGGWVNARKRALPEQAPRSSESDTREQ